MRSSWLKALRHPVGLGAYATLAWMASSIAMVGGALGSGFDDGSSSLAAASAASKLL